MIVNWTKDNIKIIPAHVPTESDPTTTSRFCSLAPGYNDIPDELWKDARTFIAAELADGRIVEEWAKAPKPEKAEDYPLIWQEMEDARESKSIKIPASVRDINRPAIIDKVIKKTFHLPTLKKWSVEENRPDVQKALVEQTNAVETGAIVG